MKKWVAAKPLSTGAAAVYPYSEKLAKRFTAMSRFEDLFALYRVFGKGKYKKIALPRRLCPMGMLDHRKVGLKTDFDSKFESRSDEQERVIKESSSLLIAGGSHILQAPTGFGKTYIAMDVIANVGLKTIVVVTKEDARDQWHLAARKVLELEHSEIGFIQADQCEVTGRKIVIAMIQSIAQFDRYPKHVFDGFGLAIWDEVHRVGADHFSNTCWIIPAKRRWGLSATPYRKDGKEILIYAHIGNVSVETTAMRLVPRVFRVQTNTKFPPGMKVQGGKPGFMNKVIARDIRRNHFIARFVHKAWSNSRNTIVFSDSLDHLDWLYAAMRKLGVASKDMAHYVGGLTKQEREFAKAKPILLATYAYTSEATDIPWLDTMVMATPRADVVQIVGRVLREHPNKPKPIVLDLVDPYKMLRNYAKKRLTWYAEIGADVKDLSYE